MKNIFKFEDYILCPVRSNRELNFVITNKEGYVCRLVPDIYGFGLSPLDKALGNVSILPSLPQIIDFILQYDA